MRSKPLQPSGLCPGWAFRLGNYGGCWSGVVGLGSRPVISLVFGLGGAGAYRVRPDLPLEGRLGFTAFPRKRLGRRLLMSRLAPALRDTTLVLGLGPGVFGVGLAL